VESGHGRLAAARAGAATAAADDPAATGPAPRARGADTVARLQLDAGRLGSVALRRRHHLRDAGVRRRVGVAVRRGRTGRRWLRRAVARRLARRPADARIIGTSRSFAIGDVVARAWTAVSGNLLPAVGITALAYLAMVIAGFIPCLGSIINIVVQGPILGGLYIYFLKLLRTNNATFEDALSGFSMFLPLLLYTIVSSLLLVFAMVPSGIIFFVGAWLGEQNEVLGFLVMAVAGIVAFVPLVYLAVSWVFSVPLIVDKRFDFWPAMELSRKVVAKRFFNVFGLLIVSFGIVLAGALALCVGIFVAAPLCLAALAAAYDDLFGHEVKRWA
jgi:hypothetical protein